MPTHAPGAFVLLHSSDELYGADRVLLDVVASLTEEQRARAEVWLPTDLPHGPAPLCTRLVDEGVTVVHRDLPVLRRAYLTPRGLPRLLVRLVRSARDLRRARPDVVYVTTSAGFLLAPAARVSGVPTVLGHVQELWGPTEARVLTPLARGCHALLCISEAVLAALPEPLHPRAAVVVNATPAPARVVPLEGREGPLEVVMSGRWNAWKGHGTLLRAWDLLTSPARLVVLGGPPESGERVDVPALVGRLRHPESVEVVGETPDPGRYVEAADVVVVPSDLPEPFGLVAIEAFARGRPVVGSDDGGLAEIVTTGHDGWLFPRGDADALTEVLSGLTRPDVERAGRRARATYEARFTRERFTRDWQNVLERALADRRGSRAARRRRRARP